MNWLQRKLTGMAASGSLDDAREAARREDFPAALEIATTAQKTFQDISDDRGVMRSLCIIADAQLNMNALEKADIDFTRAQALCDSLSTQTPNSCDFEQIGIAMGLGDVRRLAGKDDEAEKLYRQALAQMEKLGYDDTQLPESAQATNGIATILVQRQMYEEAEKYFARAFTAVEFPPNGYYNLYTLSCLVTSNYADLLRKLNKLDEAIDIEQHAEDLKNSNPKNPSMWSAGAG